MTSTRRSGSMRPRSTSSSVLGSDSTVRSGRSLVPIDAALTKSPARAIGEVHLRQMGRRNIDRDPGDPAFGRILEVAAARGVPVVVHYELTDAAAAALDRALAAHRKATLVLAHAGEG